MEELFYLPPRAEAPVADYGLVVGIRSRFAERGTRIWALIARLSCRRSSWYCRSVLSSLIDHHPDAGSWSHSDRRHHTLNHGRALRGQHSPTRCSGGQFFTPTAEFNLQYHHPSCARCRSKQHRPRYLQCANSKRNQGAPSNYCPASIS
jgi:hypothetical protein